MLALIIALSLTVIYFLNLGTIIRRFIPKGKLMEGVSIALLGHVQRWMNTLPRKILNYLTPEELFEDFLDQV